MQLPSSQTLGPLASTDGGRDGHTQRRGGRAGPAQCGSVPHEIPRAGAPRARASLSPTSYVKVATR